MARNLTSGMLSVDLQQMFVFSGKSDLILLEKTASYKLVKLSVLQAHSADSKIDEPQLRSCIQTWIQHKSDRKNLSLKRRDTGTAEVMSQSQ